MVRRRRSASAPLTITRTPTGATLSAQIAKQERGHRAGPYTVAEAMADYLEYQQAHRKSYATAKVTIEAHILPAFGKKLVSDLTSGQIRRWHHKLAAAPVRQRGTVAVRQINSDDADAMRAAEPPQTAS